MSEREHQVFGDWRDLRYAIDAADPTFKDRPAEERKRLWNFAEGLVREFHPLKAKCCDFAGGCGKVIPWSRAYRCADCNAVYCERCIRPHFATTEPLTRHSPPASDNIADIFVATNG